MSDPGFVADVMASEGSAEAKALLHRLGLLRGDPMTPDECTNALVLAGEIIGLTFRLTPEQWREVAAHPGLGPSYRASVLALAEFRARLDEPGTSGLPAASKL